MEIAMWCNLKKKKKTTCNPFCISISLSAERNASSKTAFHRVSFFKGKRKWKENYNSPLWNKIGLFADKLKSSFILNRDLASLLSTTRLPNCSEH